jgi:hypothetical protein
VLVSDVLLVRNGQEMTAFTEAFQALFYVRQRE